MDAAWRNDPLYAQLMARLTRNTSRVDEAVPETSAPKESSYVMTEMSRPAEMETPSRSVPCPVCLARLDWDSLPPMKQDPKTGHWTQVRPPEGAGVSPAMIQGAYRDSFKQCPNPGGKAAHYLPIEYGKHGRPIIIAFAGQTMAGKTHLLGAMVKLLTDSPAELKALGIASVLPVDRRQHRHFMATEVLPLFAQGAFLRPTTEQIVGFRDAFVVAADGKDGKGPTSQVVAFFDIAGGDLQSVTVEKAFLDLVDGLVFVVDADALRDDGALTGDLAFSTVMDLLVETGRAEEVTAAVTLMKGDLVRFEEPIDLWWRRPAPGTRAELIAESRDVFAYIDSRGGEAWLRPVGECGQTTLHVVSATGGPSTPRDGGEYFERDVVPHRVSGPLVAVLAMTGVITLPDCAAGDVVGVRRNGR